MTQLYKLEIRGQVWQRLTWEQASAKMRALLDMGVAAGMDFDWTKPDDPVIEYRTKEHYVYVCTFKGCAREFDSKAALAGHIRHHTLRVDVPVVR